MVEDQNSEYQEVAPQDSEAEAVQSQGQEESHDDENQKRNWRATRTAIKERDEKLARQDQQLAKQQEMLNKFLEMQMQKNEPKAPDEFANIDPDDFPTWGQASKKFANDAESIAERKYQEFKKKEQEERLKEEQLRFRERLKSKYSDFDDIVSPDAIALFEEKNPELAQTIMELKDPYKMGLQTYHYIKAFNIGKDIPGKKHSREVDKRLEENERSVPSPQTYDKRPMAEAFNYKDADYSKLYNEMMGYAQKAGFSY